MKKSAFWRFFLLCYNDLENPINKSVSYFPANIFPRFVWPELAVR